MTNVVLYATDTMADWEYGYLTAGLAMADEDVPGGVGLTVASVGGKAVTTAGRLTVQPGADLAGLDPEQIDLLVLPGGDTWGEGHDEVLALARTLVQNGRPVAGICGGTRGLARAGLLNQWRHTSNALEALAGTENYTGQDLDQEARTVVDGNVITAPGTAPLEFAKAVFEVLGVFPQPVIDAWYGLYTTGERKYYDLLVGGEA
ncbi:DJ-1/PfpI family protein [Kineosporia rhizophila]|uniref:DJ-1/PfpI family protein n=1 Tax=Kineosporia rhizophila TaxID=84633 RepID=UPI001E36B9C2|nr:DJ-1/PfpI family protein [Kineosporia rhizophila]MCE0538524.1 DJ-1/PfpI family protein [Kineosporia rhizophila]